MKLVLDTNIYLAALLANGLCYDLTECVFDLKNGYEIFISSEIFLELYNKIASKKEIVSSQAVDRLEYRIRTAANLVRPTEKIRNGSRDKNDNKILECAVAAKADLIITMDKDLLKLKNFRTFGIIHPRSFFYMLSKT